jgi:hypothetical protein
MIQILTNILKGGFKKYDFEIGSGAMIHIKKKAIPVTGRGGL